jgi:hypothetical protein
MADAEPLKATFYAMRRRERAVLAPAAITYVVLIIAMFIVWGVLAYFAIGGAGLRVDGFANGAGQIPPALLSVLPLLYLGLMFTYFLLTASFEAACLRWLIRGERGGLFGLTLGADTWRVYGSYWIWFFAFIGFYLLTAVIVVATSVIVGLANLPGQATPVLILACVLASLCAPIYLAVRWAPAAATSIGQRRFSFFDAWKVSRGRFWALFGSYLLLTLLNIVVLAMTWGVLFATIFGPLVGDIASGADPQRASADYANVMQTPASLAIYYSVQFVAMILGVFFYVLGYGVNARAVLAAGAEGKIDGVMGEDIAKTFE